MINPVCPHCNVSLKPRRSSQIGRFYCPSCFGVVANTADLARVLSQTEIADFRQQVRMASDGSAPCTHCRKKMKVVWHHVGEFEVELDSCVRCDVVWFDTGETRNLDQKQGKAATLANRETTLEYARALVAVDKQMHSTKTGSWTDEGQALPLGKTLLTFMNLPVEEEKDFFDSEPWVTWLLIGLCTLVSLLGFFHRESVYANFAYLQSVPLVSRIFRGVTSFFVHADIFHLLGNMYFLWIFGDNVEDELGKRLYLAVVFVATLAGALFFGAYDPMAGTVPLVGASGGIAGLVAFYLLRFPHRRFMTRFFFVLLVPIPGLVFGALFFVKDIFGAYVEMSGGSRVAHLAHLGGAVVGVATAFLLPRKLRP